MLKLLAFRSVIRNVARNIRQRLRADRTMQFNQSYSTVEVEANKLTKHYVMLL